MTIGELELVLGELFTGVKWDLEESVGYFDWIGFCCCGCCRCC